MKIVIVGAGITGLYLAWKLSQKGEEVIVFEKKGKIGKEVCSGLFSERIFDFIPESKKLIQNEIKEVLIHFPRKTSKIIFKKSFFVMSHYKLDNLVAHLAQNSGAKIILNNKIDDFPKEFDPHTKRGQGAEGTKINEVSPRYGVGVDRTIGCDGANSVIRRELNLSEPRFFLAIQGFLEKKDNSNYLETWATNSGFIWRIPRGENIEYGIMEDFKKAKNYFDRFLKEKKIYLLKRKAAIIPQTLVPIIPKNSKITLCGDATGLTKPWSGGGVVWSLISADILLKNFPDFIKYKKEVNKFFLPKIIFSKIIKKTVYFSRSNFPWLLPKEINIEGDFLF
ncbi:FAD-dependent oxidoreductase [Candidatus Parcubacteria bacterium]|nr:FAD-dependent oxidoreductase [Candidatus Parcubacteria bacterium]